jgi:pimeloyl-ACP methyl ester carboxylesterase
MDLETPRPLPVGACLAVGFLGGVDHWNDPDKGVRRLALDLRDPVRAVFAETFENRRTFVALSFLEDALDANDDGRIDADESRRARLVVYGHSLGGWAAVEFSRMLADRGIPVEFLLQIDSVGFRDGALPANVRYAANFYQDDGWIIAGEHPVRASNPDQTRVLGNWKFSYNRPPGSTIEIDDLPWWKKAFRLAHSRMDRDPRVWTAAARLVQQACGRDPSPVSSWSRFTS